MKSANGMKEKKIFISPWVGSSMGVRGLLFFAMAGWVRLAGIEATKGSISHGETLSGLGIDAGSSQWT